MSSFPSIDIIRNNVLTHPSPSWEEEGWVPEKAQIIPVLNIAISKPSMIVNIFVLIVLKMTMEKSVFFLTTLRPDTLFTSKYII
jgi:hypothetical protein